MNIIGEMKTAQEIAIILANDFSLTDAKIAKMVGSSQPTIWRVRKGVMKNCSSSLYISMFQLLNELRIPGRKRRR